MDKLTVNSKRVDALDVKRSETNLPGEQQVVRSCGFAWSLAVLQCMTILKTGKERFFINFLFKRMEI